MEFTFDGIKTLATISVLIGVIVYALDKIIESVNGRKKL